MPRPMIRRTGFCHNHVSPAEESLVKGGLASAWLSGRGSPGQTAPSRHGQLLSCLQKHECRCSVPLLELRWPVMQQEKTNTSTNQAERQSLI